MLVDRDDPGQLFARVSCANVFALDSAPRVEFDIDGGDTVGTDNILRQEPRDFSAAGTAVGEDQRDPIAAVLAKHRPGVMAPPVATVTLPKRMRKNLTQFVKFEDASALMGMSLDLGAQRFHVGFKINLVTFGARPRQDQLHCLKWRLTV